MKKKVFCGLKSGIEWSGNVCVLRSKIIVKSGDGVWSGRHHHME